MEILQGLNTKLANFYFLDAMNYVNLYNILDRYAFILLRLITRQTMPVIVSIELTTQSILEN